MRRTEGIVFPSVSPCHIVSRSKTGTHLKPDSRGMSASVIIDESSVERRGVPISPKARLFIGAKGMKKGEIRHIKLMHSDTFHPARLVWYDDEIRVEWDDVINEMVCHEITKAGRPLKMVFGKVDGFYRIDIDSTITSGSWTVYSSVDAVKISDMSTFKYFGMAVPKNIRFFFNIEDFEPGDKRQVRLIFNRERYPAHIERMNTKERKGKQTRLMWNSKFGKVISRKFPHVLETKDYPDVTFHKRSDVEYDISFVCVSDEQMALDADPPDLRDESPEAFREGNKKHVYTARYERNPKNRKAAINLHGLRCQICGFDFSEAYGERGYGYIEVHHKVPISSFDGEQQVDPEKDLVCVCSNCHRIIHRMDPVLSVEDMREIVRTQKEGEKREV